MRVEGILDGLMYVGGPNHLLYLTQLEYIAIYRPEAVQAALGRISDAYGRRVEGRTTEQAISQLQAVV